MKKHMDQKISQKHQESAGIEQISKLPDRNAEELQIAYLNVALRICEPTKICDKIISDFLEKEEAQKV